MFNSIIRKLIFFVNDKIWMRHLRYEKIHIWNNLASILRNFFYFLDIYFLERWNMVHGLLEIIHLLIYQKTKQELIFLSFTILAHESNILNINEYWRKRHYICVSLDGLRTCLVQVTSDFSFCFIFLIWNQINKLHKLRKQKYKWELEK